MTEERPTVVPVDSVDLQRYSGLWYELGRLPLRWEDDGARDITAQYTPQADGTIRVENRCFDDEGKPTRSIGRAKTVDGSTSTLEVSFLPEFLRWIPFTEGDYWILKLADDYSVALVGTPDHKNLWLLGREAHLAAEAESPYLEEAQRQGFDLSAWIRPVQSGGRVTDDMFAED